MSNSLRHKKTYQFCFFAALIVAVIMILTACGGITAKISFSGGASFSDGATIDGGNYKAGDAIVLPECALAREGYVFTGWSDGKKTYQPGESYVVGTKSVRFTAVWAPAKLNVRFRNGDGSVLWETEVGYGKGLPFGYEGEVPSIPEAPKGHRYLWNESDGWEPSIPETFTEDTVFTAKFELTKETYRYRFYNSAGEKYREFYGSFGDPIAAPPAPPVKDVPAEKVHVERYDFIGWKSDGEADSEARKPDDNGSIGILSEERNFYPVYREVLKIYTLTIADTPEGASVAVSGGVSVGGSFEITVTPDNAHDRSEPYAVVDFSGTSVNVSLTDCGNGVKKGVVGNISGNGVVTIYGISLNRYAARFEASHAEVTGLKPQYFHGETVAFTVTPDEHYNNGTPVVTLRGAPIAGKKTAADGKITYVYAFEATDDVVIAVTASVNRYAVNFVDGDGTVDSRIVEAGAVVALPQSAVKTPIAEFEYAFESWKERNGKLTGTFAGGAKLEVFGNYTFDAVFSETRRSYQVRFRVFGEQEETVFAEYGKTLSEVVLAAKSAGKDPEATVRETALTHVFTGWTDETGAEVSGDTVITGERFFIASYRSEPTKYAVTYRYRSAGADAETVLSVPYGTLFGTLKTTLPKTDDLETVGKYPVWRSGGTEIGDGYEILTETTIEVLYRTYVYTVEFYNEKGELVPEWTVEVEWGNAAAAPSVPQTWQDNENVYTFARWSGSFSSVTENLTIRPEYDSVPRVYNVVFHGETGAEFIEIQGDKTYRSELRFRLRLDESVDAAAVKVLSDGGELLPNEAGVYTLVILGDAQIYLDGVGTKKFTVTLPESETYTTEALDPAVVAYGNSFRFRITKGAAYSDAVPEVKANGVLLTPIDGIYTVANVKENVAVEIAELPKNAYAAEFTKDAGILKVTQDKTTVLYGEAVTYTVTLDSGYENAGLLYETKSKHVAVSNVGNVYTVTVSSVTERLTIRFYGTINEYTVQINGSRFTADVLTRSVKHGETFTAEITVEESYDRAVPSVSTDRAVLEKLSERTYRLSVQNVTEHMTVTVTPKLNEYTVGVSVGKGIRLDGAAGRIVRHGDTAVVEYAQENGYTQKDPVVTISDGTVVTPLKTQNGWKITISVTSDLTVSVEGVPNVYSVTLPSAEAQSAGEYRASGAATATHGSEYEFSVAVSESRNQTPPVVTLDGETVLSPISAESGTYRYRVTATEEYIVSVETVLNEYAVKFVYPDGTAHLITVKHYGVYSAPDTLALQFNERETYADYITGWNDGEKNLPLLFENKTATKNATYTANFKTRYFTAKVGAKQYLFVETALENAAAGETVELLKPGTDAAIELGGLKTVSFDRLGDKKEYEVKTGVTVKLPYGDNAYSIFTDGDKTRYNPSAVAAFADTNPNLQYFVLLLPADYVLNLYGTMEIGGVLSQPGQGIQGHTSGNYAEFDADGTLNIYGTLNTFGYVKGKGAVNAPAGASVTVPFVVRDYRGGTNTTTVAYKNKQNYLISPFNLYELPNVQPEIYTIYYGAKLKGYASLYASSAHNATVATIVSTVADTEKSLLKLDTNAKIVKKFDTKTHKSTLKFFGNVKDGELYLKISLGSASSKSFLLPISYQYDVTLSKGAVADLSMRYKWMPGASLTVENGAVLNLKSGAETVVYETYTVTVNQNGYSSAFRNTEYNVFYQENLPAAFRVDGTMNLESNAKFGGMISGAGTVNIATGAVCSASSKEGNSGDTSSFSALLGSGNFYPVFETTQTARGNAGGVLTEFQAGNSYVLS